MKQEGNPLQFSVLLSVYHKERADYLDISLCSIFNQTYPPHEVVLVKDGPLTTELEDIIDIYKNKYEQLIIIPLNENKGLAFALNEGLKHCTHKIIARMDSDDIAYTDRFEKQLHFMNEHAHLEVVGSFATKIDEKGKRNGIMKVPISHEEIMKYIWTSPFIHPSVMFRKSAIQRIGSYNPQAGPRQDDYELWFRCAINGLQFANIAEPLLYYRSSPDSLQKNTIKVGWHRLKVGFHGCRKIGATPLAYIGITVPFIRSLLPYPLNKYFQHIMNKVNPRSR